MKENEKQRICEIVDKFRSKYGEKEIKEDKFYEFLSNECGVNSFDFNILKGGLGIFFIFRDSVVSLRQNIVRTPPSDKKG